MELNAIRKLYTSMIIIFTLGSITLIGAIILGYNLDYT